ncbi:hypothetical protein DOTSEDRAFT_73757 [Dothistroma septosporum NZE10]|uniref:Uncharacterized protein n=1 Tax=Dothistroma septosporum (strain NZE10 / CBS 128990) TaxID=675120 RepID=N1PFP9_DOTSN|nr:hypothetical protein DOTSEDRAFT_73757 [Dothistroma septosporum NZE10]
MPVIGDDRAEHSVGKALFFHLVPGIDRIRITVPGSGLWVHYLSALVHRLSAIDTLEVDIRSGFDDAVMEWKRYQNASVDRSLLWGNDDSGRRIDLGSLTRQKPPRKLIVRSLANRPYSMPTNELEETLVHIGPSLQHVSSGNVIFYEENTAGFGEFKTRKGMDLIMKCLKSFSTWTCSIKIPKIGCYKHDDNAEGHNSACGKYTVGIGFEEVGVLEEMAVKHGAELQDGVWDFAPKPRR